MKKPYVYQHGLIFSGLKVDMVIYLHHGRLHKAPHQ